MNRHANSIATKVLLFLLSLGLAVSAWAAEAVGTVVNLNGPLLARKADGTVKVLAQKSSVHQGDTLVTEKDVYARIRFIDDSEVTLRPNSQFRIANFSFDQGKPQADKAEFNLVQGGLRAVTGALGKRSQDRVGFNTPTATIGIRGTTFIAEYVPPPPGLAAYRAASLAAAGTFGGLPGATGTISDFPLPAPTALLQLAQNMAPPATRAPGLYVQVIDGMIHVSNNGGSVNFGAGQFGFAPNINLPPVILPADPGMQFSPPPAYSSSSGAQGGNANAGAGAGAECEVR